MAAPFLLYAQLYAYYKYSCTEVKSVRQKFRGAAETRLFQPEADIRSKTVKIPNKYHQYLNVIGGFLAATVERIDGTPTLIFRHYDSDGNVKHEERLEPAR